MKKTLLLLTSGILFSVFAYAGKNGVTELQREKEAMVGKKIISSGFFLNIGFAFPSQSFTPTAYTVENTGSSGGGSTSLSTSAIPAEYTNAQSLGFQPSIEIGNQWYFWKNEKMGVGLRVSWFQFGYSSYTANYGKGTYMETKQSIVDLRFFKLAPQFTLGLSDKMALDFSIEVSPTLFIGAGTSSYTNPSTNETTTVAYAKTSFGFLFAPGVKFRYSVFAVGFDFGFGSLPGGGAYTITSSTGGSYVATMTGNSSTLFPRLTLGFKF